MLKKENSHLAPAASHDVLWNSVDLVLHLHRLLSVTGHFDQQNPEISSSQIQSKEVPRFYKPEQCTGILKELKTASQSHSYIWQHMLNVWRIASHHHRMNSTLWERYEIKVIMLWSCKEQMLLSTLTMYEIVLYCLLICIIDLTVIITALMHLLLLLNNII